MRKTFLATTLITLCALTVLGQGTQKQASGQASKEASASIESAGKTLNLQSGTRLAADLQSALDVSKAKTGDQVVLKTTKAIKSDGKVVVNKGAKLVGHVTEVQQSTSASGTSSISVMFERLEDGAVSIPISATITAITRGRIAGSDDNSLASSAGVSSSANTNVQRTPSSGSLLGGATNTVGGVVKSTTSATGDLVSSTAQVVGSTVSSTTTGAAETTTGVSSSLGRIQITESTSASAEGSSVLSVRGQNLRIDKGTTFHLVVK